jgi:T5orf172 domain
MVTRPKTAGDILPAPCLACGASFGLRDETGWVCANCGWRVGDVPDAEIPRVRADVVYYLRFRDRIKIGTSGNPRSRLTQLRYDELLAFELGDRLLEQQRHAQFAEYRFPGSEWFTEHKALTRHIRSLSAGVDDPWILYGRWTSERLKLRLS